MALEKILTDEQWELVQPVLPKIVSLKGKTTCDDRRFIDAVLWQVRSEATWRQPPENLGHWNTVYPRFSLLEGLGENICSDIKHRWLLASSMCR